MLTLPDRVSPLLETSTIDTNHHKLRLWQRNITARICLLRFHVEPAKSQKIWRKKDTSQETVDKQSQQRQASLPAKATAIDNSHYLVIDLVTMKNLMQWFLHSSCWRCCPRLHWDCHCPRYPWITAMVPISDTRSRSDGSTAMLPSACVTRVGICLCSIVGVHCLHHVCANLPLAHHAKN